MAKKKKKIPFFLIGTSLLIMIVLIVLGALMAIPGFATYKSGLKTYKEAKLIVAAAKNQNISLVSDEIVKTKQDLLDTQKNLHHLIFLKFVPLANWYYNDADH